MSAEVRNLVRYHAFTKLKAKLELLDRWDQVNLNAGSISSSEILRCADGEFVKIEQVLAVIDQMLTER